MKNDRLLGLLQLVLVIVVVVAAVGVTRLLQAKKETAQQSETASRGLFVTTEEVMPGSYQMQFETTGSVAARAQVGVIPQVAGRVDSVLESFYAGGFFQKDEVLFQIDPRDYAFQVDLREAEVARAETSLQLERAEAEAALAEWRQLNGDKPAPDLVARIPQLQQAEANLKAAKAQLDNARLNLDRTSYRLPFSGRVMSSNISIGQYVAPGQAYAQVFDVMALEVEASLTDLQLRQVLRSESPVIEIQLNYLGEQQTFPGYLIRGAANLDAGTRFAPVRFGFKTAPEDVVPGVFVTVSVLGEQIQGITEIPAQAMQKDGSVWHVLEDNTLAQIEPQVVDMRGDRLAVRGINQSIRLVTSRLSGATEGTQAIMSGQSTAGSGPVAQGQGDGAL
jgi:RND family efflux transporter MFP subunit